MNAEALGVRVLAAELSQTDINAVAWRGQAPESMAALLGSAPASREAQLWSWSLASGEAYEALPDPQGWHEMVLVTEGQIRLDRDDARVDLVAGQHSLYSTAQRYSYRNTGTTTARFVRVVIRSRPPSDPVRKNADERYDLVPADARAQRAVSPPLPRGCAP
ncbi:cupin domain-containing protein [Streptomyces sp. NPDC051636]|uniref:cupin domain-containing protein n=1 Tax=Streptomyces sp. NPDC051636 TaxID=3365663 RepID=UPI0037A1BD19